MFKIDDLKRLPVQVKYCPHDIKENEGLKMELNLDLLTIEKMDELDAEFKAIMKAVEDSKKESSEDNFPSFCSIRRI